MRFTASSIFMEGKTLLGLLMLAVVASAACNMDFSDMVAGKETEETTVFGIVTVGGQPLDSAHVHLNSVKWCQEGLNSSGPCESERVRSDTTGEYLISTLMRIETCDEGFILSFFNPSFEGVGLGPAAEYRVGGCGTYTFSHDFPADTAAGLF
jgi:hypothetical protein